MKRRTFKILFLVKQCRAARDGQAPVFLRVTVDGVRAEVTLTLKVDVERWNSTAGRMKGSSRKDDEINKRLDTIRLRIMQIYRTMEMDDVSITSKGVIDEYLGRNTTPDIMLTDFFREHNDKCRQLIGKDMTAATVQRYETCLRHVKAFIKEKYGCDDITISRVNHKFVTDFEFYFKVTRGCSHNTTVKYLKNFKKITTIALVEEVISHDPFAKIKFHFEQIEKDFLEDFELQAIASKEFAIERLAHVRDVFIFCCFTGLGFSDVKQLTSEHIIKDKDDVLWIRKRRQKTNNMCNIPLLNIAQQILERYKGHPACKGDALLPVPSNQRMNGYLKEITDICGINKQVSTHTARHSFASSVALANGVSIENVAKMLGHSDTKMTRHYAKVLDKSLLRDMAIVNKKMCVDFK